MAEELLNEELDEARREFYNRFLQAYAEYDEYYGAPQLTCGQYYWDDVHKTFGMDVMAAGAARPTDYETFKFFSAFDKKFSKEIQEYKELKERLGNIGADQLREAYLDENKFPANHIARTCNPYWKFDG